MNSCLRCGYTWSPRSGNPTRCPECKSTRWNTEHITHTCRRCSFKWNQRGESKPRYCPSCHSAMWNEEKITLTCPKCGRTRALRSNSRTDLCPYCDGYGEKRPVSKSESADTNAMNAPIRLWSDGMGLTLTYIDNGAKIASLYNRGNFLSSTNFEYWCRSHNYVTENVLRNLHDSAIQEQLTTLAKRLFDGRHSYEAKAAGIQTLRPVTEEESNVIALFESGVPPIAIAMKFNMPFAMVMDIVADIPPMQAPEKLRKSVDNGKADSEEQSGRRGKLRARNGI